VKVPPSTTILPRSIVREGQAARSRPSEVGPVFAKLLLVHVHNDVVVLVVERGDTAGLRQQI
jgi:hypothetical protein